MMLEGSETSVLTLEPSSIISKYDPSHRIDQYFDLLMAENQKVNLVSRETSRVEFDRMVAESLLPFEVLEAPHNSYLDIGSGGGLPAVPILLTQKVSGNICLLERTQKKASALQRISSALQINATVLARTFEEFRTNLRFDLVTLRYVKLSKPLLLRILEVIADDGLFLYYSSPTFSTKEFDTRVYSFTNPQDGAVKRFSVFRRK
jgi:16S rRNA (guanine(527)-N(7))-methyltransferase RsmG